MIKKITFKFYNNLLNDFRLKLLYFLAFQNKATQQYVVNEWLSKNESDLGTIRRAIIELLVSDYIEISDVPNLEKNINYKDAGKRDQKIFIEENLQTKNTYGFNVVDFKSSQRLVKEVNSCPKIPKIKMHITLKGFSFLNENKSSVRYPIVWFISLLVSLILGAIINNLIFN